MNLEQWQRSKKIKAEAEAAAKRTVKRVLNAVKEPAMSEFKVGDKVVNTEHKNSQVQKIELVEERRIKVFSTDMSFSYWAYNFQFRHATPEEIAAGHRIDKPSDSGELETLDKPENHISPNCEVKNG